MLDTSQWISSMSRNLKIKSIREGKNPENCIDKVNSDEHSDKDNNKSNEIFVLEVLAEGTLDIEVMIPAYLKVTKQPWNTIYEVIDKD